MAEGGAAAPSQMSMTVMGGRPTKTPWGKYLNNWRMAQIHAKNADRFELEQWSAVFDRTLVANQSENFGGTLILDLLTLVIQRRCSNPPRGIHSGVDVYMGTSHLLQDDDGTVSVVLHNRVDGSMHAYSARSMV